MSEPVAWPECEDFYGLMQAYRHSPLADQAATVDKYEAVKEWLRAEIERKDAAIAELLMALYEIEGGGGVQGEVATNALAKYDAQPKVAA